MAQNALGRRFLRTSSELHQTLSPLIQRRCQSTKVVPSFTPSSSSELDQKLNRIRHELFVPMYLAEHQKRLVFRERYRDRLNEEQVKITIGEEEFTLQPKNRQTLPEKKEINQAIEAMKTSEDWRNFVPLLTGSLRSKHKHQSSYLEKWIRLAAKYDNLSAIVEAAKQSSRTGFSLSNRNVAFRFAYALHLKAKAAEFKGEETVAALRFAEQVAQLMEWPAHTNQQITEDPKHQPFFIAVLTELSAARAIDEAAGEDVDGKVLSYVQKLLGSWKFADLDRELASWYDTDRLLQEGALLYSSLRMALNVKSVSSNGAVVKSIEERLKELREVLSKAVNDAPEKRKEHPTLGLWDAQSVLESK